MEKVLRFIDDERARFVAERSAWAKIPAISAAPEHRAELQKNAAHLAAERLAADRVEIWPTGGGKAHPAVFAELTHAPGNLYDLSRLESR